MNTTDQMIEQEQERVDARPELPLGNNSGARLKSFIERVERLDSERKVISEDIKDVYAELKAAGFEPKIAKKIVALRKQSLEKRREESELLELYQSAIGMAE